MIKYIKIKWTIVFLFLYVFNFGQSQKEYKLISKHDKSDFRYKLFKKFKHSIYSEEIRKAFTPKKGKYDVYFFISEELGNSYDGTQKLFHDYLILKTEPKTKIIKDAFQYTIEWTDDFSLDLYRLTENTIHLKNHLNLDLLKMKSQAPYAWIKNENPYLLDGGQLIIE